MSTKTPKRNGTAKQSGTAKRNGTPKTVGESDILTLEEAAAFLRVPGTSLQAEAIAGKVPGKFVAGNWRFSRAAFLTWLQTPAETEKMSGKDQLMSLFGLWKDDPTVDQMIADIERRRREDRVAGD